MALEDIIGRRIQQAKSLSELGYILGRILNENEINEQGILLSTRKLVDRIGNLKIIIHPDDHSPAHFHVLGPPSVDAKFTILGCERIKGFIEQGDEKKVRFWHKHGEHLLIKIWNETRPTDRCKDMI